METVMLMCPTSIWAGLVRDYYRPRYALYASLRAEALRAGGTEVNATAWLDGITDLGAAFGHATALVYPAEPVGDALAVSQKMFDKYAAAVLRGGV
jgi:hypothetical protein